MARMPHPDRDPLAATRRLLVDGNNLLHALSKTATAAPASALIGRLRGIIPAAVTIELVFDGPPERGLRNERIASGVVVRYSGGRTADSVILTMIEDVRLLAGADGTATLLVVTDDRDLRHGARLRGARTAGSAWLLGRLGSGRLASPSIGNPRPARPHRTAAATATSGPEGTDPEESDQPRWAPGRGATTKRGNPRRAPRSGRQAGNRRGDLTGG
jgi:predicted RNA-binding protein with PIN domain